MADKGGVVVVVAGEDNTERVFKQIEANLSRVKGASHEAESALTQLGERGVKALEYFGIALGIREVISQFKELVGGSLELGEALQKASQKTGLSVGTLSTLHYAAAITASDFDAMSGAVAKLDKSIGAAADGDKKAASFLDAIGLNAKELVGRSDGAEIAFKKLAQTIAATENPIMRVRLATGLLGKAGAEQIDTLIKVGSNWDYYKQKATDAGVQLDGKTAESLERTNERLRDLQQKAQGAGLAFTEGLIPGLNAMFDIFAHGQNHLSAFESFGSKVAKSIAFIGEVAYSTAAALEYAFSFSEGSKLTEAGRKDLEAARELKAQAEEFHKIAFGPDIKSDDKFGPPDTPTTKGGGFKGTGDIAGADKLEAAKKARAAAQLRLDEQASQLRGQLAKDASEKALAQLDADHKRGLVSDSDFYAQKLALQLGAIEKEKQAAIEKQTEIDKSISVLQADAKKKGGATAVEDQAKILDLRTKRLAIDGEIAKLAAEGSKAEIEAALATTEAAEKRLQLSDELAAKREEISGASVDARLKQSSDAYALKRKGLVTNYGADSSQVQNADADQEDALGKIRAKGADTTFGSASVAFAAQKAAIQDDERRGVIGTAQARQQLIALDREEAEALKPVLAAYQALAQQGDLDAANKVVELGTKIRELENPVDDVAAHMREQLDGVFESMFDNIGKGKKGWEELNKQVQKMVLTDAYKAFLEPLAQSATGALIPNGKGAAASAPGVGGIGAALGKLIPGLGGVPGVGKGIGSSSGVTVQIINQGTPMESGGATQHSSDSGDDGFSQRVISVILKDAETNGAGFQALIGAMQLG